MTTGTARFLLSLALCACVAGSANAKGVANAVKVAARLLEDDIVNRIAHDLGEVSDTGFAATGNAK